MIPAERCPRDSQVRLQPTAPVPLTTGGLKGLERHKVLLVGRTRMCWTFQSSIGFIHRHAECRIDCCGSSGNAPHIRAPVAQIPGAQAEVALNLGDRSVAALSERNGIA